MRAKRWGKKWPLAVGLDGVACMYAPCVFALRVFLIGEFFPKFLTFFFAQFFNLAYFPGFFFQINIGMFYELDIFAFWRISRIVTERLRRLIHSSNYFQTLEFLEKTLSDKNES